MLCDHWLVWRVARLWWHRSTLYRSKTSFLSENHVSASTVLSLPMTNPSRIVYVARCGRLSVCPYRGDTVLVVACKNRIRRSHPTTPVLSSHPHIEIDMHSAYPAQGGWQALWLWRLVKLFAVLPSLAFCRAQSDGEERTNICLHLLGLNRMAGDCCSMIVVEAELEKVTDTSVLFFRLFIAFGHTSTVFFAFCC